MKYSFNFKQLVGLFLIDEIVVYFQTTSNHCDDITMIPSDSYLFSNNFLLL